MAIQCEITAQGRMVLTPDSRRMIRDMNSWERHFVFHDICRRLYAQQTGEQARPHDPELARAGIQSLPGLLSADDTAALQGIVEKSVFGPDPGRDGKPSWGGTVDWDDSAKNAVIKVLTPVLQGTLGQVLEGYFGSYFRIMSLSMARAFPSETEGSFLWHRDMEPPQQTHLMIYLTESSEQGGGTEFLDFEDTTSAAQHGVHFQIKDAERHSSIETIRQLTNRDLVVHRPHLMPGDGLLFAAPRVLHQGRLPTAGHRDTVTLLFLPSLVPWDTYLARNPDEIFVRRHPGASSIEPFEGTRILRRTDRSVPDWATLGGLFPPGYEN